MEGKDTAPDVGFVVVDNRLLKRLRQDVDRLERETAALRAQLLALARITRNVCIDKADVEESVR